MDGGERPEKLFPSETSKPDFYILGRIKFFVHRVIYTSQTQQYHQWGQRLYCYGAFPCKSHTVLASMEWVCLMPHRFVYNFSESVGSQRRPHARQWFEDTSKGEQNAQINTLATCLSNNHPISFLVSNWNQFCILGQYIKIQGYLNMSGVFLALSMLSNWKTFCSN